MNPQTKEIIATIGGMAGGIAGAKLGSKVGVMFNTAATIVSPALASSVTPSFAAMAGGYLGRKYAYDLTKKLLK